MTTNKFSAHIGYLFTELPVAERVAVAAKAGFTAIEHPQPFAVDAKEMRKLLADNGLFFSQLAGGVGDTSKGEKGLGALAGREADFRAGFDRSLEYALTVGAPFVHPMAGVPQGDDAARWIGVYTENVQYAVERTSNTGVKVPIEAISHAAVPGYAVSTLAEAARIQDIFGPGNVALLVDTYHAAANGLDTADWLRANPGRTGHIHIADCPGRHEPGTGNIEFARVLDVLAEQQFAGAIGFEYVPSTATVESAAFLDGWKSRSRERVTQ